MCLTPLLSSGYAHADETEQETIKSTDLTEEQIVVLTINEMVKQQVEELVAKKKLVSNQKVTLEMVARDETTKAKVRSSSCFLL